MITAIVVFKGGFHLATSNDTIFGFLTSLLSLQ